MTATAPDLAEAFRRLVTALAWLEDQPNGHDRARGIRTRLAEHLGAICDGLAGKTERCRLHERMLAHNCPACRSERIGRDPDDPVHTLPPVPADAALVDARRLGESTEGDPA